MFIPKNRFPIAQLATSAIGQPDSMLGRAELFSVLASLPPQGATILSVDTLIDAALLVTSRAVAAFAKRLVDGHLCA